jgi:hypothetical protein
VHGRKSKNSTEQEADLGALLAAQAAASQRVVVKLGGFSHAKTGVHIFIVYHAARSEGVDQCSAMARPLTLVEAICLLVPGCRLHTLLSTFVLTK